MNRNDPTRVVIKTSCVSGTIRIGKTIGTFLQPGDVVALVGDLGTGKTHMIKGLAAGAGVKRTAYVSSPSFTLINEYPGKIPFYHLDLYRLQTETEAEALGLEEVFQGRGVTAIEWADKIPSLLPRELLWIHLQDVGGNHRSIEITGKGRRYQRLMEDLEAHIQRRDSSAKPKPSRLTMPTMV
jgi:tRNA threonylcarbamoyladenosine biosynthesis protein TsaE